VIRINNELQQRKSLQAINSIHTLYLQNLSGARVLLLDGMGRNLLVLRQARAMTSRENNQFIIQSHRADYCEKLCSKRIHLYIELLSTVCVVKEKIITKQRGTVKSELSHKLAALCLKGHKMLFPAALYVNKSSATR
jgi:hypothetical protein